MNNKYDVTLNNKEKEELIKNVKAIMDYLTGLLNDYDVQIELEGKWTFYDNIWGTRKYNIVAERTYRFKGVWGDSEKEWYTKIKTSNVFRFDEDLNMENIGYSCHQEYALSLIDNWKGIKEQILTQLEQAKKTRALTKGFEL